MSKWDDDLKAIAGEIDRRDERIEYFHRLAVSRLERIGELELSLATAVNRCIGLEKQLEIRIEALNAANRRIEVVEAALARANREDVAF